MGHAAPRSVAVFGALALVACHVPPPPRVQAPRAAVSAAPLPAAPVAAPLPRITSMALGGSHTCVLLSSATLRCWGEGDWGALGSTVLANIGDDEGAIAAPEVPVGAPVKAVAAGSSHTCALLEDGRVRCWGRPGLLGFARPSGSKPGLDLSIVGPSDIDVGAPVVELAAGASHSCARTATGGVRCWGFNNEGQLGNGVDFKPAAGVPPRERGDVPLGSPARRIWAGGDGACALLESGKLSCWGTPWVFYGRDRTNRIKGQATPAVVDVGGQVKQVVFGHSHACALLEDGSVRCWGDSPGTGLGNVTIGDDEPPSAVRPLYVGGRATALAAGHAHTCALLESGAVRCWGQAAYGSLGYGNRVDIGDDESPAAAGDVALGGKVAQVAAGGFHTCALLESGRLRCWGMGSDGELGYGNVDTIGDDETPQEAGDVPLFTAPRPRLAPKLSKKRPSSEVSIAWDGPETSASSPPTCGEPCRGCRTLYDSTKRLPSSSVSLTAAEDAAVQRVYTDYIHSEACSNDERHLDPLAIGTRQDQGRVSDVVAGSFTAPSRAQKLVLFFAGHCGELGAHSEHWGQRLLILLENERVLGASIDESTSSLFVVDLENDGRAELVTWGGWTGGGGESTWLAVHSFADERHTIVESFPEVSMSNCSFPMPGSERTDGTVLYRVDPSTHEVCFLERKRTTACPKR